MSQIFRTEGIVIHTQGYRDTSKLVTSFTLDWGRLRLLARGARRPGSRFGASLEPLTRHYLVFYRKEGREVYTLSEAGILERFPALEKDEKCWCWGMVVAELLLRTGPVAVPNRRLFHSALRALRGLGRSGVEPDLLIYSFLLQALGDLGYQPYLEACIRCNRREFDLFSIPLGGGLCRGCARGERNLIQLGVAGVSVIRRLSKGELPTSISLPSWIKERVAQLIKEYLGYHLDGLKFNSFKVRSGIAGG